MQDHHRSPSGRLWASLIFLLPLPTFFVITVFTRTLTLDQVATIVTSPPTLLGIGGLAAVALVLVGMGYRPFVTRPGQPNPEEVSSLQAGIIQFPKLVLAGGLVFGAAFPFVPFFTVAGIALPPLDFFLLGYSNAIFFSMPCYIVFLQVFEESNRDIPYSEQHVSMSLTLRFSLVLGFVLTSILSVLLVAFKNVLAGGVEGDAWGPIVAVGLPIGLMGLGGGLLNSVLLVRGILKRLTTAKAFVLDLAGGDLSKPALETTSRDELGALGSYLNLVQRNLGELLGSTLGSVQKTVTIKDELVGICHTTNQEIGQMGNQVARVDAQAQEITEAVAHALGRVSNLRTGLEELNRESSQQAAMVQETSASLAQMTSAVETLAQLGASRRDSAQALETQTAEGQAELQATLEQLRQIASSVEDIRNITGVIQGIAAQTNLLSMNAAIEAAHAGQAGAGFAVVASEIRKLAETSSRNSKDITAKVKTIVLKIDQAVQAGTTTSTTFARIHDEMAEFLDFFRNLESSMAEMRAGSQTIVKATDVLQQVSDEVKTKAASMDQDAAVVVDDMVQLQARAEDTRAAMTAVGSGIREVDHAAQLLRNHTFKLDESAQQATVTLERFRVSGD